MVDVRNTNILREGRIGYSGVAFVQGASKGFGPSPQACDAAAKVLPTGTRRPPRRSGLEAQLKEHEVMFLAKRRIELPVHPQPLTDLGRPRGGQQLRHVQPLLLASAPAVTRARIARSPGAFPSSPRPADHPGDTRDEASPRSPGPSLSQRQQFPGGDAKVLNADPLRRTTPTSAPRGERAQFCPECQRRGLVDVERGLVLHMGVTARAQRAQQLSRRLVKVGRLPRRPHPPHPGERAGALQRESRRVHRFRRQLAVKGSVRLRDLAPQLRPKAAPAHRRSALASG
jgi:hypothetical protein